MFNRKRKASEQDLFLAAVRAAAIAWAKQIDSGQIVGDHTIEQFVDNCFAERKVEPSPSQKQTASMIVQCLLGDGDYISKIVQDMVNGTVKMTENDYRRVMSICQQSVASFNRFVNKT